VHLSPQINLGEVIGWLFGGAGLMFALGTLKQRLVNVETSLHDHRSDFQRHEEQDNERFDTLNLIWMKQGEGKGR
jgi:hypothetical protein